MSKISENLSRRALVAAAAVAVPVAIAATAMPASAASLIDSHGREWNPKAALDRCRQAVEALRTRVVCGGWQIDEIGAERTLRYFQQLAAGGADNDDEHQATCRFLVEHGQSLDWIFDGNLAPMIAYAAARSPRAQEVVIDPIFAAIENHERALAEQRRVLSWRTPFEAAAGARNWWYANGNLSPPDGTTAVNIEVETAIEKAFDVERDAAVALVNVTPLTVAGAAALLRYSARMDEKDMMWPGLFLEGAASGEQDGIGFHTAMQRHVADALEALV